VGLAVAGTGTVSYRALAAEPAGRQQGDAESVAPKATPAEVRVKRLKKQLGKLQEELHQAEEEAARERAVPPRKTPVAVIFGNVPVTRDELADYLLSRMTAKQLEQYVNRRILEHACKKEGITVTQADVDAHFKEEMTRANLHGEAFQAQLRTQWKMTLQEWKEDVIRTRLMLQKLSRSSRTTEKELRREFEARYGGKVECQYLIWPSGQMNEAQRVAANIRAGRTVFRADRSIKISRRDPKLSAALKRAVFDLEPGEISCVVEFAGSVFLFKCVRHIPRDTTTRFEDVRECLKRDIEKRLVEDRTLHLFKKLKDEARVKLLWSPPEGREGNDR
jgi:hypothetical protein